MDWLKKHRRDIIELVIMGGLLLFTNWDKEAFKALIAGMKCHQCIVVLGLVLMMFL